MRVLMTADTVGGVWQFSLELARALMPYGIEVHLAAMGPPPTRPQRREAAAVANLRLYARDCKLIWMADPWRDVEAAGRWLRALASRVRPALVHLNDLGHGDLDWPAPVVLTVHSCVYSWWQAVHGEPPPAQWGRYHAAVQRSMDRADAMVTPTAALLAALRRHYRVPGPAFVVPNGRRGPAAEPVPKEALVLSAGRLWDEAKNISALCGVAGELPWPVYVAGETRHPDGGDHGHDGVRPLGHLATDALARWYAHAAIYALPARYEPFGLTALEAGLARCALVLGDIPSLRELWGGAAWFVPADDARALRAALETLIEDEPLRRDLAERAHERALHFKPEKMAAKYWDLYAGFSTVGCVGRSATHHLKTAAQDGGLR